MIKPQLYEINIALANDKGNLSENFFYQKFDDYSCNKVREVIRVVNGFIPDKPFRLNQPQLTIDYLNGMTDDARVMADQTGASLNWELLKILNKWIEDNL